MNAKMKINEIWKAINFTNSPTKIFTNEIEKNRPTTRSTTSGKLLQTGSSNLCQSTLINYATKAWSLAPNSIKRRNPYISIKKYISFSRVMYGSPK